MCIRDRFGGHLIKKHEPEAYDYFLKFFGYAVAIFNIIAVGLIMTAFKVPYVDRLSAAFLNIMVIIVIITLLNIKKNSE